tara:strand:- start:39213 stop:40577 length:1365 start_codon:yes stop_codon:yes gene_type:complete
MQQHEFIQPLLEAKGLFGRKPGDIFTDDNTQLARFAKITMYPDKDSFPDIEQCDAAKLQIEKQTGQKILWVNARNKNYLAFAIAELVLDNGEPMLWGRHYQSVPKNLIGSWGNGETPGTWHLQTRSAKKMKTGLTPQDLIGSEQAFANTAQLVDWIEGRGANEEIIAGLRQLAQGQMPVFVNQAENLEAIRDYLGEIMQPIALWQGMIAGDADLARREVLRAPWKSCQVQWPQGKNNNLIDSNFVSKKGAVLGISSKGANGANASSANIWLAIVKAQENNRSDLLEEHADMIDIMQVVNDSSAEEAPLKLALRFELITPNLAQEIRTALQKDQTDPSKLSQAAQALFDLYGSKQTVPGFKVSYVLIANVAKTVSKHINNISSFGQGCLAFLNQASILQVYTQARVQGNDVAVTGFTALYPPEYSGTVYLDAGKNYFSSRIAGKLSFKYVPVKPT